MGHIQRDIYEVKRDIELIVEKGIKKIKLYHNPYYPDTLRNIVTIAEEALENDMHVSWIENNDTVTLDGPAWGDYNSKVMEDLVLAHQVGVHEFLVGNEISLHNDGSDDYNDDMLTLKTKNLANEAKDLFPNIDVGYQDGWWKKDAFHNSGIGVMDSIHFTLYETFQDFEKYAVDIKNKFGKRAIIGEWSSQRTMGELGMNEREWAQELENRNQILDTLDLDNYYFCFRDTGLNDDQKGFGLWQSDKDICHMAWNLLW